MRAAYGAGWRAGRLSRCVDGYNCPFPRRRFIRRILWFTGWMDGRYAG